MLCKRTARTPTPRRALALPPRVFGGLTHMPFPTESPTRSTRRVHRAPLPARCRDVLPVLRRVLRPLRRADLRRRGRADGHGAVRVDVPGFVLRGGDGGNGVIRPDVLRGVTNETRRFLHPTSQAWIHFLYVADDDDDEKHQPSCRLSISPGCPPRVRSAPLRWPSARRSCA